MANLKEIRSRITSVRSTMQITSAMKMVSASKLRRAQDAILQLRPYAVKLSGIMANVSSSTGGNEGRYSARKEEKRVLIVCISSNRGLCGAFNSNVIREGQKIASGLGKGISASVLCIGKKAEDHFRKTGLAAEAKKVFPESLNGIFDSLNFAAVASVAERIMKAYSDGEFDKVVLVYNQFRNAAVQTLMAENYLPLEQVEDGNAEQKTDYIFEPAREEIVEELIPRALKIQLFKAVLDSYAAEHGARMTAMHKATDNAGELIKDLRLYYNKARQAAITGEILEIVAGAEALK